MTTTGMTGLTLSKDSITTALREFGRAGEAAGSGTEADPLRRRVSAIRHLPPQADARSVSRPPSGERHPSPAARALACLRPHGRPAPLAACARRSAVMTVGNMLLPAGLTGITEASMTR